MVISNFFRKYQQRIFPIVLCLSLPWMSVATSMGSGSQLTSLDLLARWAFGSTYLLFLWYLNSYLFGRIAAPWRGLKVFGINLILLLALIVPGYLFSPELMASLEVPPFPQMFFRMAMGPVIIITIQSSFKSIQEIAQLKTANFALQTENYRAQLDQLRKQVNPHFLFNSLSTLQTMVRSQHAQSEEFVLKLSDVYRNLLQNRSSNVVSLEEEIQFLDAYFYLLRTRHGPALAVTIQTLPEALKHTLPIFSLQLLVENCTKHNVISKKRPLKIEISQDHPNSIRVSNNFQPKKKVHSLGVGLDNLRKRYELLGIEGGVQVLENEHEFSVTLKLF